VDFAPAAARFCSVVEAVGAVPRRRWLSEVEAALADVYASAVRLPSAGSVRDRAGFRMDADEWAQLFSVLRSALGDSPFAASVADELASIYRALRAGVDALHSGVAPEELLFEWRLAFETQWARNALGALSALRAMVG
jgi:uncharacterized protein DUF5063